MYKRIDLKTPILKFRNLDVGDFFQIEKVDENAPVFVKTEYDKFYCFDTKSIKYFDSYVDTQTLVRLNLKSFYFEEM